jgi:hypothetical protein
LKDELKARSNLEENSEINYLEARIQELTKLIKERKEKIVNIFIRLLPDKEKELNLIQNLVIAHLEFIRAKKQRLDSTIKLRGQRDELRGELEVLLGDNLMGEIEFALDDCEELMV